VLKGANLKSFARITEELAALIDCSRTSKMLPDDLPEGTFPSTKLGLNEIDTFSPIINPPGSRSLAWGASFQSRWRGRGS
jgi:pyruvate dehydrogenase E2 component (dihydrolipoamide acetyltransferase)